MSKYESISLPADSFVLLIRSAAEAILQETNPRLGKIGRPYILHQQVGLLDELVGKYENCIKSDMEEFSNGQS